MAGAGDALVASARCCWTRWALWTSGDCNCGGWARARPRTVAGASGKAGSGAVWAATSIVVSRTFEDADYGEEDDGDGVDMQEAKRRKKRGRSMFVLKIDVHSRRE